MSANHSLPLILTLSCLVRTVVASDLVYVPAEQAVASQETANKNQLVLVQQASYQTTEAANATAHKPSSGSEKKSLKSRFFRFGQPQTATSEPKVTANGSQTKLQQPTRVAAGRRPTSETVLTNPRAEEVKGLPSEASSNSFMDRLRQLSSGMADNKADPATLAQAAVHEESANPSDGNVDGLVYVEETQPSGSAKSSLKKPDIVLTQVYSEQLEHALSALPAVDAIEVTAEEPEAAPVRQSIPEPAKIMFRPAVVDVNHNGQPVLRPDVYVAGQITPPPAPGPAQEELPVTAEPVVPEEWSVPIVDGAYDEYMAHTAPRLGPIQEMCCRVCARLNGPVGCEPGLGTERVMHAISFVETTQPMQNFRMRFDGAFDYESPDRAEYFWKRINGGGPVPDPPLPAALPTPEIDYQDIRAYMELGGDKFSVGTEIPIRIIDPDNRFVNTSGLGDVNITTKLLFLDGRYWQIANLFRTYVPSGDFARGLGTGHASIEPGFAMRYKWSDYTYLHGDLKYWVPLGGDPEFEGEVLSYGIAMSHVWRETDTTAIMPTIEFRGYSFLDGRETTSVIPPGSVDVDPEGILIIHPGIRWAWDHGTDCGLREVGLFGGFSATSDSLYEELIRLEFRWNW